MVEQINFADVLQKSFIAMSMGNADKITTINILINATMSFMIGMFIFYIYKKTYQGVVYQKSFNISLVLASIVTSMVIMTISGNLVLSLGMVGALSIVRFRTPVKDSMDLIFLFWAITVGIANGVSYYNISIVGSIMIACFLLLLTSKAKAENDAYLLVIHLIKDASDNDVVEKIRGFVRFLSVKSKMMSSEESQVTLEIKVKNSNTQFLDEIKQLDTVKSITLVAYDQSISDI